MAVLGAVLATVLLSGLGLAIALLGIEEAMLASRERTVRGLRTAAEGAAQAAVVDLDGLGSWDAVLAGSASLDVCAVRAAFSESTLTPAAPWGGATIDLRGLTASVQADSDAGRGPADAAQRWCLFANAPFGAVVPGSAPWYLAVWVADDPAESDSDSARDANGTLAVQAVALGPANGRATVDLLLRREDRPDGSHALRVLSIRPGS